MCFAQLSAYWYTLVSFYQSVGSLTTETAMLFFVLHNAESKQVGNKRVLIHPALLNVQVTSS